MIYHPNVCFEIITIAVFVHDHHYHHHHLLYLYLSLSLLSILCSITPVKLISMHLTSCFNRKTKGFDLQEKLVYQIIEEAGNKGLKD